MKRGCVMLVLVPLLASCAGGSYGDNAREAFHQTVENPPAAISVSNVAGNVTVDAWSNPSIRIDAVKTAGNADALNDVQVVVTKEPALLSVATKYASGSRGGGVTYTVHVPPATSLDVNSTAGNVTIGGAAANVKVRSVAGVVHVSMAKLGGAQSVDLNETTGAVTLDIPKGSGATLHADSTIGNVSSDVPARVSRSLTGATADAAIGDGSARVRIANSTGVIRIVTH